MSQDYIIPDKEVAVSDNTSIKSSVDSEIQENGGPIVSASKLYEILKNKGILNSIDLINDNSNSIKLLNDEIGELDSTSTGYKTIANRLISLESNSGSGGDIYGFNKPKIEDCSNFKILNSNTTTYINNISSGIELITDSNYNDGIIFDIGDYDNQNIDFCNIMHTCMTNIYQFDFGFADATLTYPTFCITTSVDASNYMVGNYVNAGDWGNTSSNTLRYPSLTPYFFLRFNIDKINKVIKAYYSINNITYHLWYTSTTAEYTKYAINNKFIIRARSSNAYMNILHLKISEVS